MRLETGTCKSGLHVQLVVRVLLLWDECNTGAPQGGRRQAPPRSPAFGAWVVPAADSYLVSGIPDSIQVISFAITRCAV